MWLPVGLGVLLIFAAFVKRAEASQTQPTRSLPAGSPPKPNATNALAATVPAKKKTGGAKAVSKAHRGFYPPAGTVYANHDYDWYWDGGQWEFKGVPAFPQGLPLSGVPGGPLDGWYYDWNNGTWIEGDSAHPGNFIAPAPSVPPTGRGPLQRERVMQPAGSTVARSPQAQTAPVPAAPKQSSFTVTSIPASVATPTVAAAASAGSTIKEIASSAVRILSQKQDPHPNDILNTAVIAKKAGYDQTAATLTDKAIQKSQATGIPLDTTAASTIKVTSIPALSNAQRVQQTADALTSSIREFSHAADPQSPETHPAPAQAPMTFEPDPVTHGDAMTFEPDPVHHNLSSPIPGIDDETWTGFAYLFEDDGNSISPQWQLGHFKISALRLQDLGMMKDARQAKYNGKTVWEGNFIEPLSMQIFLNDPKMQYDTFVKEMQFLSNEVEQKGKSGSIPMTLHGYDVTRSGLLAIAKMAGPKGFDSFIKNDGDWDKYPNTRDAFLKANGLF